MNNTQQPTIWRIILTCLGWLILAYVALFIGAIFGSTASNLFFWGVLLVGLYTYRGTPRMRTGFIIMLVIPVVFYILAWLVLFANYK